MKTKLFFAAMLLMASVACNKEECYHCHYDAADGSELEIEGEYCGEAAEDLENTGFMSRTLLFTLFIVVNTKRSFLTIKNPGESPGFFLYTMKNLMYTGN